ncbi:MAG: TolC family protein, partial [Calditrichota bacterium]
PSFSLIGRSEVEKGIFAGLNPVIFPRMARRIALNVQRILLGEDAGTIPYAFPAAQELSINMSTARKIGVYPSWGVITEAILIQEQRKTVERELSLKKTLMDGIEANLDLIAKNREVAAGKQTVREALANLLPQVDLSATALQIDEDRAGAFQAEQTLTGTATLTQVIYSDDALTNHAVQKNLQNALLKDRDAFRLDIATEMATAYLQLLSAKTFEEIVKDNLQLSHSNLDLARIRESIGYSGRAEVYRWESEIATNRRSVIEANAQRNVAEIQVNRLLNRPLEENFVTAETGMTTAELLNPHRRILRYMDNPWAFKTLRLFLVEEGVSVSPEIQQIDAAIAAQERVLKNTNRSFFLPDLVAQTDFSRLFVQEGAGSEPVPGFDRGDDNNWSVALNMSFPLYSGGAKFAVKNNALETLHQLRTERKSLVDKIEQRVRSAAHITGASFAGIEQSQNAADAAGQNLDLVRDSYSRGVLSIVQLLDAQNAALIADQSAADAVFAFLIDLIELERATGSILLIGEDADVDTFFGRMDKFFEAAGVSVK